MQAHILAHFIKEENSSIPPFPFICLTISGGHTQIVKVTNHFSFEVLGETIDDAVGEAFDKSAKILGLPYPGGPLVDKYAQLGNPKKFSFTKPKVSDLDFSFSGLKTGILYFIQRNLKENSSFIEENLHDICASIQYTIVEILMQKLKNTVKKTGINHVAIAGGVSANSEIRKRLQLANEHWGWTTYIPKFEYTTDNAAMIAITGYLKFKDKKYADISVKADARLKVSE
jgi:N6-L-threonylcarbamoyladenine synthase